MARPKKFSQRLEIMIDTEALDKIKTKADKMDMSVAAYVRLALKKFIKSKK